MTKRLFQLLLALFFVTGTAMAQTLNVSGNVKDKQSEPIVGASVVISNTTKGTVTDLDGNFTIQARQGDELTISYIGFKTKKLKVTGSSLNVTLEEEDASLNEVVVVGAVMRKSDLTGSVAMVDSKVLEQRPVTSVNEAIQGRMPGVSVVANANPADDSSIKIRGVNTINSGSDPIYVVDGQVMDNTYGGFSSINPNDVENIQVLKDASATAIYGSRGANGVVLITTKKAKKGEGQVNYAGFVSVTRKSHIPETMSARQLGDLRIDAFANGYMMDHPTADRQSYINNTLLGANLAFSPDELDTYNSGRSYNWIDQVLRTGVQQDHTVSFSNGIENGNVYASLNYSKTNGILGHSNQEKYNGRINADTQLKPWLKIGTNTSFNYTTDHMHDNTVYTKALNGNPLLDYAPYADPETMHTAPYEYVYYQANNSNYNNEFNPFAMEEVQYKRNRQTLSSTNYLNINPLEGLNFRSTLAVQISNQKWMEYMPGNSPTSVRNEPQTETTGDANAKHERWTRTNWQWDNTLTYDHTFNKVHHMNLLAGTSFTKTKGDYTKAKGYRFASDDLGYKDLGAASKFESTEIGSNFYTQTLMSYLVRGNYVYDNKYYATVTARLDGSSKFASGHKWGLLPSFSLAWDIRQEKFMQQVNWLDKLKLRVGYGVSGNQDIENYVYSSWYKMIALRSSVNGSTVGASSISRSTNRGTESLTWEKQKQFNVGLDVAFLNNRVNASFDYFNTVNDDLLMQHSLASTTGYNTTWENIGQVKNNGVEFNVNAAIIQNSKLQWNANVNISHDKNKVSKLYGDVTSILNGTEREGNIFLNKSLHTIYTLKTGGIATESNRSQWEGINYSGHTVGLGDLFPLDISGPNGKPDSVVNEYDKTVVGKTDPKWYGGFSTDVTYQGFTLNAVFNYQLGVERISNWYESLISSYGLSQASTDLLDRWSETNTNAKFPRVVTNTSSYNGYKPYDMDFSVQNAAFLRLSTLSLSYNFDRQLIKSLGLNALRLYVTANNLFVVTDYKGMDPETGDTGYPPCRSFTFGINLTF